jgi:hypothetical protein
MKCKACNVVLLDDELKMLDMETAGASELCGHCLEDSNNVLYEEPSLDSHEYQFGDDTLTFEGYNEDSDY